MANERMATVGNAALRLVPQNKHAALSVRQNIGTARRAVRVPYLLARRSVAQPPIGLITKKARKRTVVYVALARSPICRTVPK